MFNFLIPAIKKAGSVMKRSYAEAAEYRYKADASIVTDTDIASEKILVEAIVNEHPSHSIFSEEMGEKLSESEYLWVVDPLDGTTNFSHRIPHFCISIGLVHKKEVVAGAVYQPLTKELFIAEKGKGAYLNDKKLTGSSCSSLNKAVACVLKGPGELQRERFANTIKVLIEKAQVHNTRVMGATALDLCFAAAGRVDLYCQGKSKFHDWIAGSIIASEAGMKLTDFQGYPLKTQQTDIVAANETLHPQLLELLKHV